MRRCNPHERSHHKDPPSSPQLPSRLSVRCIGDFNLITTPAAVGPNGRQKDATSATLSLSATLPSGPSHDETGWFNKTGVRSRLVWLLAACQIAPLMMMLRDKPLDTFHLSGETARLYRRSTDQSTRALFRIAVSLRPCALFLDAVCLSFSIHATNSSRPWQTWLPRTCDACC